MQGNQEGSECIRDRSLKMMEVPNQSGIICIGTSLVDLNFRLFKSAQLHTSNPAQLSRTPGGVVRNIAHHLSLLGNKVELLSLFGNDGDGKWLKDICESAGISLKYSDTSDELTGTYASILSPEGELTIGAAAAEINKRLDITFLAQRSDVIKSAELVLADCNLNTDALKWLISFCTSYGLPLVIETVSVAKSERLLRSLPGDILMVKPNFEEMQIFGAVHNSTTDIEDRIAWMHQNSIRYVWLSMAEEGSILSDGSKIWNLKAPDVRIKDTTGAGDAATAGWIHAYLQGKDPLTCMKTGHATAAAILETEGAVRNDLSAELLKSYLSKI